MCPPSSFNIEKKFSLGYSQGGKTLKSKILSHGFYSTVDSAPRWEQPRYPFPGDWMKTRGAKSDWSLTPRGATSDTVDTVSLVRSLLLGRS